ncbi:MAG: hypothetical protein SFW67_00610 [Myxococcaceae bacterium]|nr:hypothetical protein [Myxococcaceae bacterium]
MASLERTFDRKSPALEQELAAFQTELMAFAQQVAPATLITRKTRKGSRYTITVMSGRVLTATRSTSHTVEAWKP